jgi:hypothetical protein
MTQLDLKDWIVDMYQKYEVNNPDYQKFKETKKAMKK